MSFLEDIKRPFNLLIFAIAIISLLTAFYFYYFPRKERGIAFTKSNSSLIYDSSIKSPNFSLVDSSSKPITANTYLLSFTFWNTGSQPIEPSEVRRPITVNFPGAERILDYKIIKASDQDVSGFAISDPTNDSEKKIQLTWSHFDPRKGVSFQTIVCQTNEPQSIVSADIVGITELNHVVPKTKREEIISWITASVGVVNFLMMTFLVRKTWKYRPAKIIMALWGVMLIALIALIGVAVVSIAMSPRPPF